MSKQHLSTRHSLCHHSNRMADIVKAISGAAVDTMKSIMALVMAAGPRAMEGF